MKKSAKTGHVTVVFLTKQAIALEYTYMQYVNVLTIDIRQDIVYLLCMCI